MNQASFSNLVLIGYKSTGKTYFGKLLSSELDKQFIDTDQLVEAHYKKLFQKNLNCKQISLEIGEGGFRNIENKMLNSLYEVDNAIIAAGGGAILHSKNHLILRKLGTIVYLQANKEFIKKRIFQDGVPSFLDIENPEVSFEKMYDERKPIYEQISDFTINIHEKTDKEVLDQLTSLAKRT
ncbi:MAG: Shikimate kinase 1 [Chlamydiae bacterium]|nr:Shikimate kinase 1 [Chlamydiota bacterium]